MRKLLILTLALTGCVGPDYWDRKEPWQREVFNRPAAALSQCVSQAQGGRPISREPGSNIYIIKIIGGGAVQSEMARAVFRDLGNRTEVTTYGITPAFRDMPIYSTDFMNAARSCGRTR